MASIDWNVGHSGLSSPISPVARSGTGFPALSSSGAQGDSYNDQVLLGPVQPTILSDAQIGLGSAITPAGRDNNTVPTGQGQTYAEFNTFQSSVDVPDIVVVSGRVANVGSVTGVVENAFYKMEGFYVAGNTYETWVSVGSPNPNPPSGHTLINIAIVAIFFQHS